jgi:dihydrofolate synthase / folylpolyglutamate synthase
VSLYSERLHDLFQLEFFGMKLGLENIRALLEFLKHPEQKFRAIHIAGTNGKGSVSAMLAGVHQAAGKRTGLYTSPHLVDFRERIRIDGEMISQKEVSRFLKKIWPKVEELRATFFEVTTAMAFDHFARHRVDIAIVETGLGGRLDATNVLEKPLATVITSIGMDHMAQLGPTLESIALEKAGIFKLGVPAIINCDPELEPLFRKFGRQMRAPVLFARRRGKPMRNARLWNSPFPGIHQAENILTVRVALDAIGSRIPIAVARHGIRQAGILTGLRGRLEEIETAELRSRRLRLFLDVGHNPQAMEAVGAFFEHLKIRRSKNRGTKSRGGRPIVIAGIMKDKDVGEILARIRKFASRFIAVNANTPRALRSTKLHAAAKAARLKSIDGGAVWDGLALAIREASAGDILLLTGSHYVVGEFLENFQKLGGVSLISA